MTDLRKLINIVEQILLETPQQLRAEIDKKVQKVKDEEDLTDILKYTNRYTIKSEVDKFSAVRQYKDIVNRSILKALANTGLDEPRVKKFLNKLLTTGILDYKALLTPRVIHSTVDIIDSANKEIFDLIKFDLFSEISGKIGEKGDVGKGEYLLDIISPNVNRRGAPGDLDINGVKIELKAGQNGRLGPSGATSLVGRFDTEFKPFIASILPKKVKQIGAITEFNPKKDMSYFSDFFETPQNVKLALTKMLQMHYNTTAAADIKGAVNRIVAADGSIDGNKISSEMLKLAYNAYKAEKEFDGIIVMDAGITAFVYINTADDLAAMARSFVLAFPSWTDAQSNCIKLSLTKNAISTSAGGKAAAKAQAETDAENEEEVSNVVKGRAKITPPGAAKPKAKEVSAPRQRR